MAPHHIPEAFHYLPVNRRMIRLGCYLTSIGSLQYRPNTPYPLAGHPDSYVFDWSKGRTLHEYALIFITAGKGRFESAKVPQTTVKAGHAFYLVPGEWHRYGPHQSVGWSEKWITFNGPLLHLLRNSAIISHESRLLKIRHPENVDALLDHFLADVGSAPKTNKLSWGARALEMLLLAFEDHSPTREFRHHKPEPDPVVAQALNYIRYNCHRPLTVDSVVAYCHTARRTLERRFAAYGVGPIAQEIIRVRIERAEMLLKESRISIKEIAYACGFGTPQRMIYSFRQNRDCTPGSLRKE